MAEVSPIQYKENVGHYPPPTFHQPYKYKVFGVEGEILIKYKRIKWTPIGKTLRIFSSQGDKKHILEKTKNKE